MNGRYVRFSLTVAAILCVNSVTWAQTVHQLPFDSEGNVIELTIANIASVRTNDVVIEVQKAPSWLEFSSQTQTIKYLDPDVSHTVRFIFSVAKTAPVSKEETIRFVVRLASAQLYTRDFRISVAAPEQYLVFQNYPNPFNPTTVIRYQIPVDGTVNLRVYDLLGRVVETLVDEHQAAGYYKVELKAIQLSSGVYFYALEVRDEGNRVAFLRTRKLMVVK